MSLVPQAGWPPSDTVSSVLTPSMMLATAAGTDDVQQNTVDQGVGIDHARARPGCDLTGNALSLAECWEVGPGALAPPDVNHPDVAATRPSIRPRSTWSTTRPIHRHTIECQAPSGPSFRGS